MVWIGGVAPLCQGNRETTVRTPHVTLCTQLSREIPVRGWAIHALTMANAITRAPTANCRFNHVQNSLGPETNKQCLGGGGFLLLDCCLCFPMVKGIYWKYVPTFFPDETQWR